MLGWKVLNLKKQQLSVSGSETVLGGHLGGRLSCYLLSLAAFSMLWRCFQFRNGLLCCACKSWVLTYYFQCFIVLYNIENMFFISYGWLSCRGTLNPAATTHKETEVTPIGHLTNEEWNKINSLLSYQPEEDTSKQEAPDMMQFALDVRVQQCTARVLDRKKMEILCGTFEDLQVGLKVYPKTLACEGKLQFYGLSAPEGVLIEVLLI